MNGRTQENIDLLNGKHSEQYWDNKFEELYMAGKIGQTVLDDDLPAFQESWVVERMNEEEEELLKQEN